MPWWGWLLLMWGVVALVFGVWLGAAAALARRRERLTRRRQYEAAVDTEHLEATGQRAAEPPASPVQPKR